MPTAIYLDVKGNQFEAELEVGQSLMDGAVNNMIDGILGECGGVMSCATCHCYIDPAWQQHVPAASEHETDMLDIVIDRQHNSRLSCQIEMTAELDGIVVHLPRAQY